MGSSIVFQGLGGETPDTQWQRAAQLAAIKSSTIGSNLRNQQQALQNQQAQAQLNFQQGLAQAIGSYQNNVGPGGAGVSNTQPISVPLTALSPGMSTTLPPAAQPDSASTGDANVQDSRNVKLNTAAPLGTLRTPEGLIIRPGTPAAAQYGQVPAATGTDNPLPMSAVDQSAQPGADGAPAVPLNGLPAPNPGDQYPPQDLPVMPQAGQQGLPAGVTDQEDAIRAGITQPQPLSYIGAEGAAQATPAPPASPLTYPAASPASPFSSEVARQQAIRQQGVSALMDDPSSLTRHVGQQLLSNPNVNPLLALSWIQARQKADADLLETKAKASKASNEATSQRMGDAADELHSWYALEPNEQARLRDWAPQMAKMEREGLLTPEEAGHFTQYPGDKQIWTAFAYMAHNRELTDQAVKLQKQNLDNQKLAQEVGTKPVPAELVPYMGGVYKADDTAPSAEIQKAVEAKNADDLHRKEQLNTEPARKDQGIKAELAADLNTTPDKITEAQMNQARGIYGSAGNNTADVSHGLAREFVQKNGRLPSGAEVAAIGEKAAEKTRAQNINNIYPAAGTPQGDAAESTAQMIANYQQPAISGLVLRTPFGQMVNKRVKELNPEYHAEYYNNFNKTEQDATTGAIGKKAQALGTALGHAARLDQAANALRNNDIHIINAIANEYGIQSGKSPQTVYKAIVNRVGPEIENAYVNGGGTAKERGKMEEDFGVNLGPDQIHNNIAVTAQLINTLAKTLQDTYNRGTYGRGKQELFSPDTLAIAAKLSGESGPGLGNSSSRKAEGGYLINHQYGNLDYLGGPVADPTSWKTHVNANH